MIIHSRCAIIHINMQVLLSVNNFTSRDHYAALPSVKQSAAAAGPPGMCLLEAKMPSNCHTAFAAPGKCSVRKPPPLSRSKMPVKPHSSPAPQQRRKENLA